jgi:simple sugar transport system ATP-binding protein
MTAPATATVAAATAAGAGSARPPAVRIGGVAKAFGPVVANRDASLEAGRGEVHALVGENGAGKSTLMRVLSGMHAPDAGTVEVADPRTGTLRDVTGWSTNDAIAAGVGMVHQHFMLVPTLTVAENVVLGMERTRGPGGVALDRAGAERAVGELAVRTGLRVDPARRVADLSVGEAQRVEILKALFRGARVLVLDEPTAVLSPPEVQELWGVLRALAADGGTVVLITHKLDEVVEISEAITVMRAGATVARLRTAETTPRDVARAMVGRDVELALDRIGPDAGATAGHPAAGHLPVDLSALAGAAVVAGTAPVAPPPPAVATARPALSVRDLVVPAPRRPRAVDGVSFDLAPGEILGIAGVEGNGQTELVEAIAGLAAPSAGRIMLAGRDVTALDVRARADAGLSHIPEDRHRRGLVLDYSIADNLVLGLQHRYTRGGLSALLGRGLDRARVAADARRLIGQFDIRPADPALPARALSGGNQQKIVIAREMTGRDYAVLLASQPTRGVDVGAIEFIHDQLRRARAAGKGVLLVSADLAEVLALADRVAVMYEGRFAAVLPRAEATLERLGPLMTGADGDHAGVAA